MNLAGDDAGTPVISPDGTKLVFGAIGQGSGSRLWLRSMDELTAHPLPGTDGGQFPFWSPDGRSIGFFTNTDLKRLDLQGGAVVTLAPVYGSRGGTWSKDDVILFSPGFQTGLSRVAASGGAAAAVTTLDTMRETTHRWPQFLPDGRHFIFFAASHDDPAGTSAIWYGSLSGGKPRKLFDSPNSAVYASGWLLFVRDSTLMAQRFDPGSGRLSGGPVSTSEVVQFDPSTWRTVLTASETGLMLHGLGGRTTPFRVTWFDRTGHELRVFGDMANHVELALSPEGSRVAVETQYTPMADLWIYDAASGGRRRITNTTGDETYPVWSPDGSRIACAIQQRRTGAGKSHYYVQSMRSDGVGDPVTLYADSSQDLTPMSWSADGHYLLFARGTFSNTFEGTLWWLSMADGKADPVLPASQRISSASLSPDGRWVAFSTVSTGRAEIVVVAAPRPGVAPDVTARQWQITSNGGDKPVWRRDSRELYYVRPDATLMAVAVDGTRDEFHVLSETPLFQAFQRDFVHSYDVTADGQRFVVVVSGTEEGAPLAVVTNWTRALIRR
jgi:Tol biopolymer transport system component